MVVAEAGLALGATVVRNARHCAGGSSNAVLAPGLVVAWRYLVEGGFARGGLGVV